MTSQKVSIHNISVGQHSFHSLGNDYFVDVVLEYVPNSRLLLFNEALAKRLNLDLPQTDKSIEDLFLQNFSWFSGAEKAKNKPVKKWVATRYQDSDDKTEGSALGDGRATWAGEIISQLDSGLLQYADVVLKGTGATELAWLNHPRENHKDGMVGITEAVHEYIYSLAAKKNGISAVEVLAVIELPFKRKVDNENAAIVVRVGNHLRFAHYCYFADNAVQLENIFEYGLKRNMGLALTHKVSSQDVEGYLDYIVNNLAEKAAVYFDVHAVHGSPTFGNITSCGGSIDFATFVFIDAHHSHYSYMAEAANLLGGEWGQKEQFFNLFSQLVIVLKKSGFAYTQDIQAVEYFLWQFNDKFEQVLSDRWLTRIGLSAAQIDTLSSKNKADFYDTVKSLYELNGLKKIKFKGKKTIVAAFEPRKILSATAECIEYFDDINLLWLQMFKVNRRWGGSKLVNVKPYIKMYRKSVLNIVKELNASAALINKWKQRSKAIVLSDRNEPGADFFYDSERFFASEVVLQQIKLNKVGWRKMTKTAAASAAKLVDHGLDSV